MDVQLSLSPADARLLKLACEKMARSTGNDEDAARLRLIAAELGRKVQEAKGSEK